MMFVVRDTSRTLPASAVPFVSATLDDLYEYALELKRAQCPTWTDESDSDFGIFLLHTFCVLAKFTAVQAHRCKNDTYLATTADREVMRKLCQLINYELAEASAAAVTMTFTCESGHPGFTITAGSQVATVETDDEDAIIFEVGADTVVGAGVTSITATCSQGTTVSQENVGLSDGTSGQTFTLLNKSVIWHSETVEVYDGIWTKWTLVDDFTESTPTSKHYRLQLGPESTYQMVFGDGTNGAIPPVRDEGVRVTYRIGGGTIGNVAAGTIVEIITPYQYVESVTNEAIATGGTNQETLEHARQFAPAAIRSLQRAVTIDDVEYLCEQYTSTTYGGVAKARAHVVGSYLAHVSVIPQSGGLPSAGFKSELSAMLADKVMIGTVIEVIDPHYVTVDISADVTVMPTYHLPTVAGAVAARLQAFLSPLYQDPQTGLYSHQFGRNIYISDVYAIVNGTPGVDFCHITAPTSDNIVADYQIARPGTITITPYGDQEAPPFHDSRYRPRPGHSDV